jgi:hypothetical protein
VEGSVGLSRNEQTDYNPSINDIEQAKSPNQANESEKPIKEIKHNNITDFRDQTITTCDLLNTKAVEKLNRTVQQWILPQLERDNKEWGLSINQKPLSSTRIYFQNINGLKLGQENDR